MGIADFGNIYDKIQPHSRGFLLDPWGWTDSSQTRPFKEAPNV